MCVVFMALHKTEYKCNLKKKEEKVLTGHFHIIFYRFEIARKTDINWAPSRANLSSGFAYKKGKDQPSHPRSLCSAIVISFLENLLQVKFQFSS